MKKARRVLKWVKGNLRGVLLALAALGIVVGGWVERGNYKAKMQAQVEAHKATIVERETTIRELKERKIETVTETVTIKVYDKKTGLLLKETTTELAKMKEENRKLLASQGRVPKVPLPGQQPSGFYPLGGFVSVSQQAELGGGLKYRIVPRLVLPLVPDLGLTVAGGWHRKAFLGLLLVDIHR